MAYVLFMDRPLKTLLLVCLLALTPHHPAAAGKPLTVVELFTSQGCSSCPPADAFLGELATRRGLLALSFHVDYWDYLGWKDAFSSPLHTERQRGYAKRLGLRFVYTPQMVIQGTAQATGSNRGAVLAGIEESLDMERIDFGLRLESSGNITVSLPEAPLGKEAEVWLVVFDRRHETPVRRGENSGRTIANFNVVRSFRKIATWRGAAKEIPAALPEMVQAGGDSAGGASCAVILQAAGTGRILGAAVVALDSPG